MTKGSPRRSGAWSSIPIRAMRIFYMAQVSPVRRKIEGGHSGDPEGIAPGTVTSRHLRSKSGIGLFPDGEIARKPSRRAEKGLKRDPGPSEFPRLMSRQSTAPCGRDRRRGKKQPKSSGSIPNSPWSPFTRNLPIRIRPTGTVPVQGLRKAGLPLSRMIKWTVRMCVENPAPEGGQEWAGLIIAAFVIVVISRFQSTQGTP